MVVPEMGDLQDIMGTSGRPAERGRRERQSGELDELYRAGGRAPGLH